MKKLRFTESQSVNILKEAETGVAGEDFSHKHRFSEATFYKWKAKYGGIRMSKVKMMGSGRRATEIGRLYHPAIWTEGQTSLSHSSG